VAAIAILYFMTVAFPVLLTTKDVTALAVKAPSIASAPAKLCCSAKSGPRKDPRCAIMEAGMTVIGVE
jgi:hypothetical protein